MTNIKVESANGQRRTSQYFHVYRKNLTSVKLLTYLT